MNFVNFKKIGLEDYEIINSYYKKIKDMNCEYTTGNTILWSMHYQIKYTILEDFLVFKTETDKPSFIFPIGDGDIKAVFNKLFDYCNEKNIPFQLHAVNSSQFELLNVLFPNEFAIEYNRDDADYIYLSEDLKNLTGKKYHGKKNHINKFMQNNTWNYERINQENIPDCIQMANEWRIENNCDEDQAKSAELCVTLNSLKYFDELNLQGGLIKVDGKVIAFTIGEPLNEECFVVHIEKAFSEIQGAYPMINQQSILDYGKDYKYINREEDLGVEGLRKAKLSYRPIILLEKGVVKRIKE